MPDDTAILDFSQSKTRSMVIAHIRQLRGCYRFKLSKVKRQRSLPQNAYYWGCVLKCVQAGIEDAWGERKSIEWCHLFVKGMFLTEPVINRTTGEQMGEAVRSTSNLSTEEFGEFLDSVIQFCGEKLGVEVPTTELQMT